MSRYDKQKKQFQYLIEKEAWYLRNSFGFSKISALKYNYYRFRLLIIELTEKIRSLTKLE